MQNVTDKNKLKYLDKKVNVAPCTTMLLEDEYNFEVEKNAVGVHFLNNFLSPQEEKKFYDWANALGLKIYFIPIVRELNGNTEYDYMLKLSEKVKNSTVMPLMNPMQIFSFIGKMKFMISCSLHGAIFAYTHNVPFFLYDKFVMNLDDKNRFFMSDRNLVNDLFYSVSDIIRVFGGRDYSSNILHDRKILDEHLYNLKCLI